MPKENQPENLTRLSPEVLRAISDTNFWVVAKKDDSRPFPSWVVEAITRLGGKIETFDQDLPAFPLRNPSQEMERQQQTLGARIIREFEEGSCQKGLSVVLTLLDTNPNLTRSLRRELALAPENTLVIGVTPDETPKDLTEYLAPVFGLPACDKIISPGSSLDLEIADSLWTFRQERPRVFYFLSLGISPLHISDILSGVDQTDYYFSEGLLPGCQEQAHTAVTNLGGNIIETANKEIGPAIIKNNRNAIVFVPITTPSANRQLRADLNLPPFATVLGLTNQKQLFGDHRFIDPNKGLRACSRIIIIPDTDNDPEGWIAWETIDSIWESRPFFANLEPLFQDLFAAETQGNLESYLKTLDQVVPLSFHRAFPNEAYDIASWNNDYSHYEKPASHIRRWHYSPYTYLNGKRLSCDFYFFWSEENGLEIAIPGFYSWKNLVERKNVRPQELVTVLKEMENEARSDKAKAEYDQDLRAYREKYPERKL